MSIRHVHRRAATPSADVLKARTDRRIQEAPVHPFDATSTVRLVDSIGEPGGPRARHHARAAASRPAAPACPTPASPTEPIRSHHSPQLQLPPCAMQNPRSSCCRGLLDPSSKISSAAFPATDYIIGPNPETAPLAWSD